MGLNILFFEEEAAPKTREAFEDWVAESTDWKPAINYDDPETSTEVLRDFVLDLFKYYPPMNGPFARREGEESIVGAMGTHIPSDYSIGPDMVYVDFEYDAIDDSTEDFNETLMDLTEEHGISYYMFDDNIFHPDRIVTFEEMEG